jgi:four helix bundle protein
MNYQEWEASVPQVIKGDILWKVGAYRLTLFIGDIGWQDVSKLVQDYRTRDLSNQLYRALGSVSANLAEGYSRGSNKDRVRFYEYALGSARECREWYYKARHLLPEAVTTHRLQLLTQVIRLLMVMIPDQRGRAIKEETIEYKLDIE